jgi:hypothetical protein
MITAEDTNKFDAALSLGSITPDDEAKQANQLILKHWYNQGPHDVCVGKTEKR